MSETINQPPIPGILLESLRNAGYTLESAVADIIDNSITAEASNISIQYRGYYEGNRPWIAVCDNGYGMDAQTLVESMRFGSRAIDAARTSPQDLGRFGLGMKMASLSQARKITVYSWQNGILNACCWDLDAISDAWELQRPTPSEISNKAALNDIMESLSFSVHEHGTIVLWENLDRSTAQDDTSLDNAMLEVKEHVALVFHRFMINETGYPKAIIFDMNSGTIEPKSPFGPAERHILYPGVIKSMGHKVTYQPYLLPNKTEYHERPSDYETHAGKEGYQKNQGFYVYRNRRLIEKATFFRRRKKLHKTQLLRIQLDIPVELDTAWNIDVRKSQVMPPREACRDLDRVIDRAYSEAIALWDNIARNGTPSRGTTKPLEPVWQIGKKHCIYEVNKGHEMCALLRNALDEPMRKIFDEYLQTLSDTFPYEQYHQDRLHHTDEKIIRKVDEGRLVELVSAMSALGLTETEIREMLCQNQLSFPAKAIEDILSFTFNPATAET